MPSVRHPTSFGHRNAKRRDPKIAAFDARDRGRTKPNVPRKSRRSGRRAAMLSKQQALRMIERAHRRMVGATYFYALADAAEKLLAPEAGDDRRHSS